MVVPASDLHMHASKLSASAGQITYFTLYYMHMHDYPTKTLTNIFAQICESAIPASANVASASFVLAGFGLANVASADVAVAHLALANLA